MPIETEVKFRLKPEVEASHFLGIEGLRLVKTMDILQVYLDGGARIRRITSRDDEPSYVFTYKRDTTAGRVEIETPITQHDFDLLIEAKTRGLSKTRHVYHHAETCLNVEVDEIMHPQGVPCLVLAEIEYDPNNLQMLEATKKVIEPFVWFEVEPDDKRFDNYHMADYLNRMTPHAAKWGT